MPKAAPKKHIGFIRAFMLVVTSVGLIALLLAYLAFYISPLHFPLLAFAGLAYPYILVFNLILLLFWIFYRIKFALIPLLFILIGWNHIGRLFVFHAKNSIDEQMGESIKVVSYNIQNFFKVNTSSSRWVTDFENENKINNFLSNQKPDILCLQEMFNDRKEHSDFANRLGEKLDCNFHYFQNYYKNNLKKIDALAIFTRYPILNKGSFVRDDKTFGLFADLKIKKDTIRVYNLHLASIHFHEEDYRFWSDLDINQEQEKLTDGTHKILGKMKLAYIKRAHQIGQLEEHMQKSPYPIIICGDFNDTPNSYAYRILSHHKNDAHLECGSGLGTTYAGKQFPAFRIDYILYDKSISGIDFQRYLLNYSDHFPISARILINPLAD